MRYAHISKDWDNKGYVKKISLQLIEETTGSIETILEKSFDPPLKQKEADSISLKKFVDSLKLSTKSKAQVVIKPPAR